MTVLVTGAAGFIGMHVAESLVARGERVIGVDNLSTYYDVRLKRARLARLEGHAGFAFVEADVADREAMLSLAEREPDATRIVHLAAQPGVRHSLVDPYAYVQANVMGHLVMLEASRRLKRVDHFVYASSSSVYGGNRKLPFAESDRVDHPVSLYAATKRSAELISESYAHLFGLPQTGLRFFTVYGPWGRPDMAPWLFADAILSGRPITLYDGGRLKRDFTFVEDIAAGVLGCLDHPAPGDAPRLLNIGNHRSVEVRRFVEVLEAALGRKAAVVDTPRPATDVEETFADIEAIRAVCGFEPRTSIEVGIPRFAEWYLSWRKGG
ncbi:NAD-dependent epimerase/dehydratase family protein [Neoroseomonas oryzicola]|uniref:NAD-dependent epimerase/dehydratase family protein n=1 Tax=Neoroseomonas oryzicola TaxID=535904 RepID=A0A9X9WM61_9PROT|nr:NAD-dependent epimerase/dehydratase family protein [Neoroseomonas oryzicola]MBR0661421.1 NAD-dependent epimerase/dehydratase family protein [Neoroseomonas oryzicola]NKE19151.1 NAD-dependent epimerase/dehydratase family protein [Neoroseomonas oryzicola]